MIVRVLSRRHARPGYTCDACGFGRRDVKHARLMIQNPDLSYAYADICRECLYEAARTTRKRPS